MSEKKVNRIEIKLPNGYKLVAEQNTDPQFSREMFIGVVDPNGVWHQNLAIVRSSYRYDGENIIWSDDQFDVLVFGNENNEDFTEDFAIGLYQEESDGDSAI